jgi:hypothetical protein
MISHDPIDRLARRAAAAVAEAAGPRVARAPDPDELRAAHERRWLRQRVVAGVVATAAVAVLVIGVAGLLPDPVELWIHDVIGDASEPEQDDAAGSGYSEWPLGIVTADRQGVLLVPFDSPDEPIRLTSDETYEPIVWAMADQRGGLIFQHEVTPPPWPPGAVLWLRAGATQPEVLIPPEAPWQESTYPRAGILPIGIATTSDGQALFVYAVEDWEPGEPYNSHTYPTRIMVADMDEDGALRELTVVEGSIRPFPSGRYDAVPVTGGAVVALLEGEYCRTVTLVDVEDGSAVPAVSECVDTDWPQWGAALSYDGRSLAWISGRTVTVLDLETGATVQKALTREPVGLIASPGGWLAHSGSGGEVLLVDLDDRERFRVDTNPSPARYPRAPVFARWGLPYHHPFDLGSGASLGSGSRELPCQPSTDALPLQSLPEPVAATRQVLFDLAAACDYQGLASLAREHATLVLASGSVKTVGGDDNPYLSEDDLVRSWIAHGQSGLEDLGIQSREPLATLAGLLTEPAVYIEHAADMPASQGKREGPVWVWPEQWVEAPPEWGTAHTDYRVGITPDGTWRFFIGGE